jgi:hypothetical protein
VDGVGEAARVGDRKAVPEAGQPGPQLGQASSRPPVLLVIHDSAAGASTSRGRSGCRPKLATTSPQTSTRSRWRQNANAPGEWPGTSSTANPSTRSPSSRVRLTGWAVTGAKVRCSRLTHGEPWLSTRPLEIAAASPAPHHKGTPNVRHSQAEQPAWSKWAWLSTCAKLPPGELPGQAAAAPAHPGVNDDVAEQVDVEAAAGTAASQSQAGANSCNGKGRWAVALMTSCLPSVRKQASGRGPPVDRRGRSAPTLLPGYPEPPRPLRPGRARRRGKLSHCCLHQISGPGRGGAPRAAAGPGRGPWRAGRAGPPGRRPAR